MERILDGKKKCTKCQVVKTLDCFGPNKQIKSRIQPACKTCTNGSMRLLKLQKKEHFKNYHQQYRDKNREKINAYHRKYKQDRNPLYGQPRTLIRDKKGKFAKQNPL